MAVLSGKICRFQAFLIPSEIFPKWNLKRPKLGNFDIILIGYEVKEALNTFTSNFMVLEIVISIYKSTDFKKLAINFHE